jgi:hypothetical protein
MNETDPALSPEHGVRLILWHRTTDESAVAILEKGFRDGTGTYGTGRVFSGVWLSNFPLDCNEGAHGDALFQVRLACAEVDIAEFEWVQHVGYRE